MNEVAKQEPKVSPLMQFKADLRSLKDAGELDMLPTNVTFEAFRNAAVVAITDNPAILQCSRESIFKSIRRLAAAGLVPDGREAAIVPFKGQAQAMPMVVGLLKVARNSGEISSIWAEVVMGDEEFKISMIDGVRKFEHAYDPLNRSGEVKGAYAVAKLKDGTIEIEAMGREQIEKRRKASANQREPNPTGIWRDWYDEMAKKTVIRALVKRLPMSSEDIRRVMIEDEENTIRDITPEPKAQRPNLAQQLAAQTQDPPEVVTGEIMPDDIPTGQVVDGVARPHWALGYKPKHDNFPTDAYGAGRSAASAGRPVTSVPYDEGLIEADEWISGWLSVQGGAA